MKIIERTFRRQVAAAPAVILWNYWDHEHLIVVHPNYTAAKVVYDDDRIGVYLLSYKLPIFSFMTSHSLNVQIQAAPDTIKVFNVGLFGVPVATTIVVKELRQDLCEVTMTYKFLLKGWRRILEPFLPPMAARWNAKVWDEDLPLKERRTKALRMGFKDFVGMPADVALREFQGDIPFELPVKRHVNSPVNFPL